MTEQQRIGGSAGVSVAGQNKQNEDEVIVRPRNGGSSGRSHEEQRQTDHGIHWRGQQVLRIIVVLALIVLGFAVGYQVGQQFVNYIYAVGGAGGSAWLANLSMYFRMHQFASVTDVFLFAIVGGLIGFLLGTSAYAKISALSENFTSMRANEKVAVFVGVAAGLFLSVLLAQFLTPIPKIGWLLTLFVSIILVYICTGGTLSMKENFDFFKIGTSSAVPSQAAVSTSTQIKILDTNVIIDGRVADVCRTGFIEGEIYVPGFVLDELQHISDSSDSLKRTRGRRGLDILNAMNASLPLQVRSLDTKVEYAPHEEVDAKLVKLAKHLQGAIVTNDFNLNKVAQLQGVEVLNINELANALKPVVLPGEEMRVMVIKEGKEMNQGIGYLDDGTMIVIEGARRRIGETLEVVVASVLQTNAGKMIFAAIKSSGYDDGGSGNSYDYEANNGANANGEQAPGAGSSYSDAGSRPYPGSRPRRPLRDR